jgi:hypothetical protein
MSSPCAERPDAGFSFFSDEELFASCLSLVAALLSPQLIKTNTKEIKRLNDVSFMMKSFKG